MGREGTTVCCDGVHALAAARKDSGAGARACAAARSTTPTHPPTAVQTAVWVGGCVVVTHSQPLGCSRPSDVAGTVATSLHTVWRSGTAWRV